MKAPFLIWPLIIFLFGCASNNVKLTEPSSYLGSKIVLPPEIIKLSDAPYRMLIYLELGECESCELKTLKLLEQDFSLFTQLNVNNGYRLDILFVINHEKNEMIDSVLTELQSFFPIKIIYDDQQWFTRNFTPPIEKQYHCFLIDDSNIIRLIGYPYMNHNLRIKYISLIFN